MDEVELAHRLDEIDSISSTSRISSMASDALASSLRSFIERGAMPGSQTRGFDSVICFGSDPRNCKDVPDELAMMGELSSRVPVLYLKTNSAKPGIVAGHFRALRDLAGIGGIEKLASDLWTRNLHLPDSGADRDHIRAASGVRSVAQRLGFRDPLIWAAGPVPIAVVDRIPHSGLVYHCTITSDSRPQHHQRLTVEADLVVPGRLPGDRVERVLSDLARQGIRVRGSAVPIPANSHALNPLSPANSDLFEWTTRPDGVTA